ncbi:hypothetical protein [Erythrobacter sp. HL-111]|uniref:hypothetical protein n=1 Tax=Erythrobacter sp. HL-111 TaxID=1798193 RepID=UPI000B7ECB6F|nr:hypothetical protein [Erythrobacter sp. HL-111]
MAKAPGEEDGILVIGKPIPDAEIRDFIHAMLFPERIGATKFYAKQGDPLCPAVIGLDEPSKGFVIERMRTVARVSGIAVAEDADCSYNLVVALVEDGPATIKDWRKRHPWRTFGAMPHHARDTVMRGPGPAYAWHVVDRGRSVFANSLGTSAFVGGGGTALDGMPATAFLPMPRNGNMLIEVPEAIYRSFVLIERDALESVSATQLADYALMRGMMQVQADRKDAHKADSILNLFEGDRTKASPSLTRIDLAMLVSLYSSRDNVGASRQRGDMLEPFRQVMAYGEAGLEGSGQ